MGGNLKLTQSVLESSGRGKSRQVYIKPDIEARALKHCEVENVSMSYLIRVALVEYLGKRGY